MRPLVKLAASLPVGDPHRRVILAVLRRQAELLTPEEIKAVSDWGRGGIGIGQRADPQVLRQLAEIGQKLPKKKVSTLFRGMRFPAGTIFGRHDSPWPDTPQGFKLNPDPQFYRGIISGVRSWSPKIGAGKYYAGGHRLTFDPTKPDGIVVRWKNPNPAAIILDTRVIQALGFGLATDQDEILADAKGARIEGTVFEKSTLFLDIIG